MEPAQAYVLVVEDNFDNQLIAKRLLSTLGVRKIELAATAAVMFGTLATASVYPDLILLDLALPGRNGFEIFALLKQDRRFDQTQVVALTSQSGQATIAQARTLGFDGFIIKPCRGEAFCRRIRQILHGEAVWDAP